MSTDYKKVPMLNAYVHDIAMDDLVENFTEGTMLTLRQCVGPRCAREVSK